MQLLIVAHASDAGANSVAEVLTQHLGSQLILLRPEWLGQARWSQRVSEQGQAQSQVHWGGGLALDSAQISLVWNRIQLLPQASFRDSPAADRDYAAAELQAVVSSFFAELGERVVPSMHRQLVLSPQLHFFQWASIATRLGMSVNMEPVAYPTMKILVTPQALINNPTADFSPDVEQAMYALAEQLGFAFLELGFVRWKPLPMLCQVNCQPTLTSPAEVQVVAQWLLARAQALASDHRQSLAEVSR